MEEISQPPFTLKKRSCKIHLAWYEGVKLGLLSALGKGSCSQTEMLLTILLMDFIHSLRAFTHKQSRSHTWYFQGHAVVRRQPHLTQVSKVTNSNAKTEWEIFRRKRGKQLACRGESGDGLWRLAAITSRQEDYHSGAQAIVSSISCLELCQSQ